MIDDARKHELEDILLCLTETWNTLLYQYMPGNLSYDSCKFGRDELGATQTHIARYRYQSAWGLYSSLSLVTLVTSTSLIR
jgi:hypothetical protein